MTVASTRRNVNISLGVMEFDDASAPERITRYIEKPTLSYEVSMGVYCFRPRALANVEAGARLDFPDLILQLLDAGERVEGWRPEACWLDLGRHETTSGRSPISRRCASACCPIRPTERAAHGGRHRVDAAGLLVRPQRQREVAVGGRLRRGQGARGGERGERAQAVQRGIAGRLDPAARELGAHAVALGGAREQHRERGCELRATSASVHIRVSPGVPASASR